MTLGTAQISSEETEVVQGKDLETNEHSKEETHESLAVNTV